MVSSKCDASDFVLTLGGRVVENHPSALSDAIVDVLENKAKSRKTAMDSIGKVTEEFSWDRIAERLERIYEVLLDSRNRQRNGNH